MRGMKTVIVEWDEEEVEVECHHGEQPSTGVCDWEPDYASFESDTGKRDGDWSPSDARSIWNLAYNAANKREYDYV